MAENSNTTGPDKHMEPLLGRYVDGMGKGEKVGWGEGSRVGRGVGRDSKDQIKKLS